MESEQVTVMDNMFTGSKRNVQHWIGHPNFNLVQHDVTLPMHVEVDRERTQRPCTQASSSRARAPNARAQRPRGWPGGWLGAAGDV